MLPSLTVHFAVVEIRVVGIKRRAWQQFHRRFTPCPGKAQLGLERPTVFAEVEQFAVVILPDSAPVKEFWDRSDQPPLAQTRVVRVSGGTRRVERLGIWRVKRGALRKPRR